MKYLEAKRLHAEQQEAEGPAEVDEGQKARVAPAENKARIPVTKQKGRKGRKQATEVETEPTTPAEPITEVSDLAEAPESDPEVATGPGPEPAPDTLPPGAEEADTPSVDDSE